MNRIYQGKITRIEHKPENEEGGGEVDWEPLPDWEEALWRHHELFQDAVNYYAVCLLALATNSNNPIRGIRNKLAGTDENGNPTPSQVWLPFRRKGVTRPGMRSSVVKYFCPENADATPENCFDAAIGDSPASSDIRNAALVQLLEACKGGGGKIRNAAPEFFPLFCNPFTNANFKADKALLKRKWAQEAMPFVLHDSATLWDSPDMDNFDVHSIGTPDKRTPRLDKEKATARITVGLELLCEKELLCGERKEEFLKILESKPEDFSMPNYVGSSVKGGKKMQMAAMMLYRFVEKSERTFAILRQTIHAPDESQTRPAPFDDAGVTEDPIKVCRGERGYVFRAFTSLDFFEVGDDEGRPCWDKFDFAAFEEALKALHQVEEKTQERQKEKNKNEFRLACMENKAKWKVAGEDEEEPPPILAGDPRVASLEAILEEMADEYESTEGESVAYGMNVRTIRGFRALRDKWNALAKKAQAKEEEISPDALSEILREYQKDNPETIGSVRLFEELLKTDNHLVWKEPAEEEWEQWRQEAGLSEGAFFADDPVRALTDKRLLMRDVERLSEPISFTPADPRYSRRQFYFSDVCDFKPNGQYKHLPNRLQIIVPMVVKTDPNGIFRQRPVRISYSAPRLFRDQLRRESNEMLTEAPFLQPMMEALGVGVHLAQDMHDCAVSLMPDETDDGRKRHLLNFPVDLDTTELQQALGKEETWGKQFAAFGKGQNLQKFYLYWPELQGKVEPESGWWWENLESFRALGVDLGQRVAAALAVIEVRANHVFTNSKGDSKPSRLVGLTGEETDRKEWRAALAGQGLFRLPGEDAKVICPDGNRREEFSGSRGRMPIEAEWKEAREICQRFDRDPDDWLGAEPSRLSFPELNDKLLVLLRQAQGRLAKLQRLSWRLKSPEQEGGAMEEILENEEWRELLESEEGDAKLLFLSVKAIVDSLKPLLAETLVLLADRILPLRRRQWEWVKNPASRDSHLLRSTEPGTDPRKKRVMGQRGLSISRIEQLEELRRRAQALNRAFGHVPGEKVKFGRTTRGNELPDPCPEVLEKLDHLKEQRINQTAHGILARALGVRLKRPEKSKDLRRLHDVHGEYERFGDPVDFIVLEDLSRYRSSQGRSRRENTRLMQWCHRAILAKVKELAEPYGIPVLESYAAYSSRFCSRTGVVGFRAVEVTPDHRNKWPWRARLEVAADPKALQKLNVRRRNDLRVLKETFETLDELNKNRDGKSPISLLVPMPGGPVFVPAAEHPVVMQADLNAAANIALRAIAQPKCHEVHSRIRSKTKGGEHFLRRDSKREKAVWTEEIKVVCEEETTDKAIKKAFNPNLFLDLGSVADYDKVKVENLSIPIVAGRGLFGSLNDKEWEYVRRWNAAKIFRLNDKEDDLLM